MKHNWRYAGLVALTAVATAALICAGCGGGGGDGDGATPAQTGSVSGVITYASTGDSLGGIKVSIGNVEATTNDNGEFTLTGVPTGQQTLVIEIEQGRELAVPPGVPLEVTVEAGQTTELGAPIHLVDEVDAPPAPPAQ